MARWRKTIKLRDLLTADFVDATVIKMAAAETINRVERHGCPIDWFEKARDTADADEDLALLAFNEGMSILYDWADAERVWIA